MEASTPTPGKVLITGASGQLGAELVPALADTWGSNNLILADLHERKSAYTFEQLDVTDKPRLAQLIRDHNIQQIYHLAALLSAKGEQHPALAWHVNMQGLLNVLDCAVEHRIQRVFWPSSIAVFGPHSPKAMTPQYCTMDPGTIYGISKQAGERLCEYYYQKHGLDVRSLRYPGLIGYNAAPGGGTTDYAVQVFFDLKQGQPHTCFLQPDARLPMMYMPDAVRATTALMAAPPDNLRIRSSYNVAALSFTPEELFAEIRAQAPELQVHYAPDYRQQIAENWPGSIDDSYARADWRWEPAYDLPAMTAEMLKYTQPLEVTR
jgi:nucleoside-diphosphate-sugar epimerase